MIYTNLPIINRTILENVNNARLSGTFLYLTYLVNSLSVRPLYQILYSQKTNKLTPVSVYYILIYFVAKLLA